MVLGLILVPVAVGAEAPTLEQGPEVAKGQGQQTCLFGIESNCSGEGAFKSITNVLLFLIGAISVIMIIVGGIRYVVSGGDSSAVQSAKNTILYAVVGLVVAILAFAVVNFVVGSFSGTNG